MYICLNSKPASFSLTVSMTLPAAKHLFMHLNRDIKVINWTSIFNMEGPSIQANYTFSLNMNPQINHHVGNSICTRHGEKFNLWLIMEVVLTQLFDSYLKWWQMPFIHLHRQIFPEKVNNLKGVILIKYLEVFYRFVFQKFNFHSTITLMADVGSQHRLPATKNVSVRLRWGSSWFYLAYINIMHSFLMQKCCPYIG